MTFASLDERCTGRDWDSTQKQLYIEKRSRFQLYSLGALGIDVFVTQPKV